MFLNADALVVYFPKSLQVATGGQTKPNTSSKSYDVGQKRLQEMRLIRGGRESVVESESR